MKNRIAVLFFAVCLLLGSGCKASNQKAEAMPTPAPARVTIAPDTTLDNEPAALYAGVETDQRVVSLVFEGYTDDVTMTELIALVARRGVDTVFFVSGITASEHPALVQSIHEAGIEIGNYGITAEKDRQDDTVAHNLHQFTRGQELLAETCGVTPTLFRCNGSVYTRTLLQTAAAAGLEAGVAPTVYLNHHSFTEEPDVQTFLDRLVRGSIISVKLGMELDAAEYGEVVAINEARPAVDPPPGISDAAFDAPQSIYRTLVPAVEWLLDALSKEGYRIVSPALLQQTAVDMLGAPVALDEKAERLLSAENYELPVGDAPLEWIETRAGTMEDFTGCALIGDSVMENIAGYVAWKRQSDAAYLADAQFLTDPNLSVESVLRRVSTTSKHPLYNGQKCAVENALFQMQAKRAYLMLPVSDRRAYTGTANLANYKLLLYVIQKQNPGIELCVLSAPPVVERAYNPLTNRQIFNFNLALCRLCTQHDIPYLDVASALRDGTGQLKADYCLDPDTYGTHLNDAGCAVVIDYLMRHIPRV